MLDQPSTAPTLRLLASGVDSLYASVADGVDPERLGSVLEIRDRAAATDEPQTWNVPGTATTFLVGPRPRRNYSVHLSNSSMDMWVGIEGNTTRPPIYIELRSLGIHEHGVEAAVANAHAVAAYFCPPLMHVALGEGLRISRIDLYADVQGWKPSLADDDRFITRGRDVAAHDAENQDGGPRSRRRRGRTFSGFTFGRGKISARIYNKTLQMASTGRDWMTEVWDGRDPDQPVWRVEVQLRRSALTDFRIGDGTDYDSTVRGGRYDTAQPDERARTLSSVGDGLEHRQALWDYCVCQWLTLRQPTGDSNRWRWPLDPVWREVQSIRIGSPCAPLVREQHQNATHERLMQGLTGYMTSLIAHPLNGQVRERIASNLHVASPVDDDVNAVAVGFAVQQIEQDVRRHLQRAQRKFMDVVYVKGRHHHAA